MLNQRNRRYLPIIFVLILSIFLTACDNTQTIQSSQYPTIKDTLEFLTSEECSGRLPGTEGNVKAQEYIETIFEKLELEPYNNSYLFEYIHSGWNISKENYKMAIKFSDGEILDCKYGEDFLENFMTNVEFIGELALDYKEETIEDKFVLLKDLKYIIEVRDKAKGAIYPMESFRKSAPNFDENGMAMIQISPKIYEQIIEKGVAEIDIKFEIEGEKEEFPQNNVVGILPGKNRENAIVLTAHFDHVGSKGDLIWKGAIDNGTGVSLLLNVAEKLKNYSEKEKLDQDIVFCAFNGEESFFQGSIPFIKDISTKYDNLYNINIDCVGVKDGGSLLIDGEENSELLKITRDYFVDCGLDVKTDKESMEGASDHIQFINNNINAIGLSQEGSKDIIHTLKDTMDKVDISYIENLSDMIVDFIIDNSEKVFEPLESHIGVVKLDKRSEEINKLNFNEYKYIEIDGGVELIRKDMGDFYGPFFEVDSYNEGKRLKDFYNIYPQFEFLENLGEYQLASILVSDAQKIHIPNPELDKVYTAESKIENIEQMNLIYCVTRGDISDGSAYNEEILISIMRGKKDDIEDRYLEFRKNEIDDKEVLIDNKTYYPIYRKSDSKLNGLYKKVEDKDKIYHIMITVFMQEQYDWPYDTIDETVKAVEELGIDPFVESILDVFMVADSN